VNAVLFALAALGGAIGGYLPSTYVRRRLVAELHRARYEATHDRLTGARNRAAVYDHLAQSLGRGVRICAAVVDVNGLKLINDEYGHAAGDRVLSCIARGLAAAAPGELVARLGGDEFVIIVDGDLSAGFAVARRAAQAICGRPVDIADGRISVTASIGVAATAGGVEPLGRFLHRADLAMYAAKRDGGGIRVSQPSAPQVDLKSDRRNADVPLLV
jgi:diguanylate cyclase (GGDEF)-like protein